MANRSTFPVQTPNRDTHVLYAQLVGAGAANMTIAAADKEIVSATRTGTGIFDIVFKHAYPVGTGLIGCGVLGTTTGLVAILTAWAPQSKTATVKFSVGAAATDPALTDNVTLTFAVRNTDRTR